MTGGYRFGLIGHNILYSRSPAIFASIFEHNGCQGEFRNYDIAPSELNVKFASLVSEGVCGFSVTIPYKSAIMEFLHDIDPIAKAIQAVNSVSVVDGRLCGFNTDIHGFAAPLARYSDELKHGRAIVLGCGGGARAVVYSLYASFEVREFIVVSRTPARVAEFQKSMLGLLPSLTIQAASFENFSPRMIDDIDVIVNCTPAGGWNQPDASPIPDSCTLPAGRIYYDLNYNSGNKILHQAKMNGLRCIDGSAMLVAQAIQSYYLWTGHRVPFDRVYADVFTDS